MQLQTQVLGVKGPSWLCTIPNFDMIDGMSIDYMHCVLLGVTRMMLHLWLQPRFHKKLWYIRNNLLVLDECLCTIKTPNEIQRTKKFIHFIKVLEKLINTTNTNFSS